MLLIKVKIQISLATLCDLYARNDILFNAFILEPKSVHFACYRSFLLELNVFLWYKLY